jgi:hypothetical protein
VVAALGEAATVTPVAAALAVSARFMLLHQVPPWPKRK